MQIISLNFVDFEHLTKHGMVKSRCSTGCKTKLLLVITHLPNLITTHSQSSNLL